MEQQIGTIISASTSTGYCQFVPIVQQGEIVYFRMGDKRVSAKITYLITTQHRGTVGNVVFLDRVPAPPHVSTPIFVDGATKTEPGVYIEVGKDPFENPIHLRLNAIFRNLLVTGKTQSGKTHSMLVLAEELIRLKVPNLIFDTQDEFLGLLEKFKDAVVKTDDFRTVRTALKRRQTIIVPMMGLSTLEKARLVGNILSRLFTMKERSYKGDPKSYPPVIVTLDEVELYAPTDKCPDPDCKWQLENAVKRGVKFGIGMVVISQRPPTLDPTIRSQCNSAMVFALDDPSSLNTVRVLAFVTGYDVDQVRNLRQGECLITGAIVPNPIKAKIREIQVHRTKNVNFEQLLNLQIDLPEPGLDRKTPNGVIPEDEERLTALATKILGALNQKGEESISTTEVITEGKSVKDLSHQLRIKMDDIATCLPRITNLLDYEVSGVKYWFKTEKSEVLSLSTFSRQPEARTHT